MSKQKSKTVMWSSLNHNDPLFIKSQKEGLSANKIKRKIENPYKKNTVNWYGWNYGWNEFYNTLEYLNKK